MWPVPQAATKVKASICVKRLPTPMIATQVQGTGPLPKDSNCEVETGPIDMTTKPVRHTMTPAEPLLWAQEVSAQVSQHHRSLIGRVVMTMMIRDTPPPALAGTSSMTLPAAEPADMITLVVIKPVAIPAMEVSTTLSSAPEAIKIKAAATATARPKALMGRASHLAPPLVLVPPSAAVLTNLIPARPLASAAKATSPVKLATVATPPVGADQVYRALKPQVSLPLAQESALPEHMVHPGQLTVTEIVVNAKVTNIPAPPPVQV